MKRRWNAKVWMLAAAGLLLIGVAMDVGFRLMSNSKAVVRQAVSGFVPEFRVGDPAPDFSLPDKNGTSRRLSQLVKRDTLLCFTCACRNCIDLQTYLAILIARMGPKAPDVISVTTMQKEREETYFRDTGLRQRVLYEEKDGPVMKQYRGHPCPRVYRLKADRTVAWIGTSPGVEPFIRNLGHELAEHLGFSGEEQPSPPGSANTQTGPGTRSASSDAASLHESH